MSGDDVESILWDDDLARLQSKRERRALLVLSLLAAFLSIVGFAVCHTSPRPRSSFQALSAGVFASSVWLVLVQLGLLWFAWRSRWALVHPRSRFGPAALSMGILLVFLGILDLYALSLGAAPFSSRDWYIVTITGAVWTLGAVWEVIALRRSVLDGAWRRAEPTRGIP